MAKLTPEQIRQIVNEAIKDQFSAQKEEILEDLTHVGVEIGMEFFQTLLKEELETTVQAHAEQLRLAQWIEEIAKQEELDVSRLASDAEKRAYALAVQKAEEAVVLAERGLADIKARIVSQQEYVNQYTQYVSTSSKKEKLADLIEQEKSATLRVEDERQRLSNLKLRSCGLKLILPEV